MEEEKGSKTTQRVLGKRRDKEGLRKSRMGKKKVFHSSHKTKQKSKRFYGQTTIRVAPTHVRGKGKHAVIMFRKKRKPFRFPWGDGSYMGGKKNVRNLEDERKGASF